MWLLGAAWLLGACSAMVDDPTLNPNPATGGAAGSTPGGSGGTAGAAGQVLPVGGAAGDSVAAYDLKGSFDLTFPSVQAKLTMGPGDVNSPSEVTPLRVDIQELDKDGKGTAVVTPRWTQPSVFTAELVDTTLVLKGTATLVSTSSKGSVTEVWQTISLQVRGGKLTGQVGALGQQTVARDSKSWPGQLTGSGKITPDATAPEGRAGVVDNVGPDSKLLPWEPLRVVLAEPIASEKLLTNLTPSTASKGDTSVSWVPSSDSLIEFDMVSTLLGYRQSWESDVASLSTQLADGFEDLAHNKGKGFQKDYEMAEVPTASLPLKWDTSAPLVWGASQLPGGSGCEGKACLSFGPFAVGACTVPAAGAAVRLTDVSEKAKLRLSVRVFTTDSLLTSPGSTPPEMLSIEMARVGQPPVRQSVPMPALASCVAEGGDLPVCSNWISVLAEAPAGPGELGLALRSGVSPSKSCTNSLGGGQVRVVVGAIDLAPDASKDADGY